MNPTLAAALGLFLCACASAPASTAPGLPEHFLTGKDARFPPDRYITGVGQGGDVSQARVTALADIGAQIQSKIEGTLVSREQMLAGPRGGTATSEVTNTVRQHATFDNNGLATVVDTKIEAGVVHVLVALDRAAAAEPYRRESARAATGLRRVLEEFAAATNESDLRRAGRLAKEARATAGELASALVMVESITASSIATDWADVARARQVDADLRSARARTTVEVCLVPARDFPEARQLVEAVMDQIASLGARSLPCGKSTEPSVLRAEGTITAVFSREPMLGDAVFCRPGVDLRLRDVRSGAEILSAALGGDAVRAAGRDREAATRTALKNLSTLCVPRLAEALGEAP